MTVPFLLWLIKDCLFLLGYISGSQNFKKPLGAAEEKEALHKLYPRVGEGEGWFGKEEAEWCYEHCEKAL